MKRLCDTFVVRHWQLGDGADRYMVQHVQSGARSIVGSLAEVYAWMCVATRVAAEEARAPPDRARGIATGDGED
jgi:hypothetical protein